MYKKKCTLMLFSSVCLFFNWRSPRYTCCMHHAWMVARTFASVFPPTGSEFSTMIISRSRVMNFRALQAWSHLVLQLELRAPITPIPPPATALHQDFGLSRHILPADGINGGAAATVAAAAAAVAAASATSAASPDGLAEGGHRASFAWESDHQLGGEGGDDSITGGVGTYLYASPEQMSGQG